MTRDERILAIVRQFVRDENLDPSKVVPEAHLADLGIDSLHALALLFRFEEEFQINIPLEDFKATTVADAMSALNQLLPPLAEGTPAD